MHYLNIHLFIIHNNLGQACTFCKLGKEELNLYSALSSYFTKMATKIKLVQASHRLIKVYFPFPKLNLSKNKQNLPKTNICVLSDYKQDGHNGRATRVSLYRSKSMSFSLLPDSYHRLPTFDTGGSSP